MILRILMIVCFFFVACLLNLNLVLAEGVGENLGKKVDTKVNDIKDYSAEKKEKIEKEFQSNLDKLDKEIKSLKAKVNKTQKKATIEVQKQWNDQIDTLEKRKSEIAADIASLKLSTGNAWEEIKSGIQTAVSDLKTSFKKAKSQFNNENDNTHENREEK